MRTLLLFIVCSLIFVPSAGAEPLDRAKISASAKWLAHVDFDAARAAKTSHKVYDKWLSHGLAKEMLREVRETIGTDLLDDVSSITFYSDAFKPSSGVVLVRAKLDKKRLGSLLKQNTTHRTSVFGKHVLHTWTQTVDRDIKDTLTGCFARPDTVLLARRESEVKAALSVLDGTSPSLAGSISPLARVTSAGTVFEAAAIRLADLADEDLPFVSPIIRQSDLLSLSVGEDDGRVFVRAELVTKSTGVAVQVREVIQGFKAMADLQYGSDKAIKKVLNAVKVTCSEKTVTVDWRLAGEEIMTAIEKGWASRQKKE